MSGNHFSTTRGGSNNHLFGSVLGVSASQSSSLDLQTEKNFPEDQRQIVLTIVQEIRVRMREFGDLTGAAYGATLERVYNIIREELTFKNSLGLLESMYGSQNVRTLIYGIKRCRTENRDKCFEKHYKAMVQPLSKKTALIHTTKGHIEHTFDHVMPYVGLRVMHVPDTKDIYYTEAGNIVQPSGEHASLPNNAIYGVRDGEIVNPADAAMYMSHPEKE